MTTDLLERARRRGADLRLRTAVPTVPPPARCEISEICEKRSGAPPTSSLTTDPFRAWRLRNAELLADGKDYGGRCAEHRRPLSYPEQRRGACSWCVPVDPEREPEYWASHRRRFMEKS